MTVQEPAASTGRRRRVVMITENRIDGDSRVQKTAMATAAAGYDVVLVGPSDDDDRREYDLQGARVILVPDLRAAALDRRNRPGRSLRWPFAFPSHYRSHRKARRMRERRALTNERSNELRLAQRAGRQALPLRAEVLLRKLRDRLASRWYKLRFHELQRASRHRREESSALDRLRARTLARVGGRATWRSPPS